jgi:hypothetical protein
LQNSHAGLVETPLDTGRPDVRDPVAEDALSRVRNLALDV